MTRKIVFSLSLLLFAGIVSMLSIAPNADAVFVIRNVRIYINPEMVEDRKAVTRLDAQNNRVVDSPGTNTDGRPNELRDARLDGALRATQATHGLVAKFSSFTDGTLATTPDTVEVTAANAHSTTNPATAVAGDIIAIAINVQDATDGIEISWARTQISFDSSGSPVTRPPSFYLEQWWNRVFPVPFRTNPMTFVYLYRVKPGDADADGDWLPNMPFTSDTFNNQGDSATLPTNIYYPRVNAGSVPLLADMSDYPVRYVTDAPRGPAPSRYHKVRQECIRFHDFFSDEYTDQCALVHANGWALAADVHLGNSPQAAYYRAGDTIAIQVTFNEPVIADPGVTLRLQAIGDLELTDADRTDRDNTLTFRYTVKEDDRQVSGIVLGQNLWHNTRTDADRWHKVIRPDAKHIRNLAGNPFDYVSDLGTHPYGHYPHEQAFELAIRAHLLGKPDLTDWVAQTSYRHWLRPLPDDYGDYAADYHTAVIKHLVDTHPPTVWVAGLVKNGETHTEDRRNAIVNLDPSAAEHPVTDFTAAMSESVVQADAFEVEFRFMDHYRPTKCQAAEIGETFEPSDLVITDARSGTVLDWQVDEPVYIGLDHRAPQNYTHWEPSRNGHVPGDPKNSASFLVYKARITPGLDFHGDVTLQIPAGAVVDIAGNQGLVSNTLTVPIDTRLTLAEEPEIVEPPAGAFTIDNEIQVKVPFERTGLRYIGEHPPYVVLYLVNEQTETETERHATWQTASPGSTVVTFTYRVAVNDVADSVRLKPGGMLVPEGTIVTSDEDELQVKGSAPAPAPSGESPETPTGETGTPFVTDERTPLAPTRQETPVIPYVPVLEEPVRDTYPVSDVPRSPIVFNELGNGSGDTNDWLEFRNVTAAAVSLKEWELSVVQDGKKEDTSLIVFPDVSVPANALLLITNSDPTDADNVLAGGDDIATAKVETKGASHLYLVQSGLSLPDDGKFLLILRKAKEKLGLDEEFVDVAGGGGSGTDAFIRDETGKYDTHVWPLQVLQAPDGDTAVALGSGKVWQRADADKVGYHKDAWAEAAFTGLGYDRKVSASAATAGTPGYPNVPVKTAAATPKGAVTFSEIMVDSGGGTLPQWIELYNNSKTDVLNLNRWELEIQNVDSEDLVGRPIVTLTLQEKLIQPNQTVLIVAGTARASSGTSLPADRIYNLLALHDKNLRIKKPQDTFLSEEGFYLKLTDRNGHLVDEIGNTDGNRRTTDAPKWVLRRSDVEGSRSSLVRRYEKGGIAEEGTRAASWVLAANVAKIAASELHYGHADDIGTPGHRRGGALPVELSSFSVKRTESGAVVVTWATESEVDNAGFNLRRSLTRDSGFTLLNSALIAGAGTTGERQMYTFTDASAKPGVEYYYQIEEVAFDGKRETLATRRLRGPVSAANRMLTTFGAVKQRQE